MGAFEIVMILVFFIVILCAASFISFLCHKLDEQEKLVKIKDAKIVEWQEWWKKKEVEIKDDAEKQRQLHVSKDRVITNLLEKEKTLNAIVELTKVNQ